MPTFRQLASGRTQVQVKRAGKFWVDSFNTRQTARSWGLELEDLIDTGHQVEDRTGRHLCCQPPPTIAFASWYETWWAASRPTMPVATRAKNVSYASNHIVPAWRDRILTEIVRSDVQRWINRLNDGLAAATVRAVHALFVEILNGAVGDGLLSTNPARGVKLPDPDADEVAIPADWPQVIDLVAAFPRRADALLVLTAYMTGMRWSELLGIRVDQDFYADRLAVVRPTAKDPQRGRLVEVAGKFHHGPPKTAAGEREARLPPFLLDLLDPLAEEREKGRPCTLCGHPHLFVALRGGPYRRSGFGRRQWAAAAQGIGRPELVFKSSRHWHRSILDEYAAPIAIHDRMGHEMPGMGRVYGHVTEDMHRVLLDGLQERWEKACAARPGWWSG